MSTFPVGRHIGVAGKGMNQNRETIGKPDGPMKFIAEFGMEVGTFTNPRRDMYKKKSPIKGTLMHHVPFSKRGYFKPEQTADYSPEEFDYIVDDKGYATCTMDKKDGTACPNRAQHMSWKCAIHGGSLHPLDKAPSDDRALMPTSDPAGVQSYAPKPEVLARMTRFQKLCQGIISVEELDDEELARGQCKDANGKFAASPPRMIPKAIHDQMVSQLFVRAQEQLRHDLLGAVKALGTIAHGEAFEPADRIKAASLIIDRVMGKNADVVIHKQDKPYEMVLTAITGGSRAESRIARGLDPETGEPAVIEGEWTDEPLADDESSVSHVGGSEGDGLSPDWDYQDEPLAEDLDEDQAEPSEAPDGDQPEEGAGDSGGPLPGEAEQAHEDTKSALRDRLRASRAERYANRENGHTDLVVSAPFQVISDGKHPSGEGYLIHLKEPKAPRAKKDQGEWRHKI